MVYSPEEAAANLETLMHAVDRGEEVTIRSETGRLLRLSVVSPAEYEGAEGNLYRIAVASP